MKGTPGKGAVIAAVFFIALGAILFSVERANRAIEPYRVERKEELPAVSAVQVPDGEKININTANAEELESLPGIGPVTAARILAYREENAGFYDEGELREVDGIGDALLEELLPYITVGN